MFWLLGGIPGIVKKDNLGHLKINVMPFFKYCYSKQELPMPLAFLGALLLLLFLLPQWWQAVGMRPKAGEQIDMNSREKQEFSCAPLSLFISGNMTKVFNNTPHCRVITIWELTFSFSSSDRISSSSSSPWAEGRAAHQRRGCERRQSTGDTFIWILVRGYEMWNFSCKNSAGWGKNDYELQLLNLNIWTNWNLIYTPSTW